MHWPAPPDRLNSFSEISLSHLGHLFCCCDLLSELLNVLVAQLGSIFNTSHFWTLMVFIEFINSHQLQLQSQWPRFSTVTVYLRCASKASLFRPFFFHALGSQCKHGGTGCYQSHQTGTGWVITSFLLSLFSFCFHLHVSLCIPALSYFFFFSS